MAGAEEQGTGRGARKRRRGQAASERRRAIRWWTRPGVLVFLGTLGLAAIGWGLVIQAGRQIPVREATVDGLYVHLDEARWILDQMDHGENFQKPSTMMPDMPEWGKQRVTLDLSFQNRSDSTRIFDCREFYLVPELGDEVEPIGAQVLKAKVGPGQSLNTAVHFDFDTTLPHGKLRVEWRRGDERVYLPVPEPAEHYHLRPRGGEVSLPPDARLLLPIGKPDRGERLYVETYGCVACHGDPKVPGSNNVGPHLGSIATVAGDRVEGMPGPQYIYQSILEPAAVIAPECERGRPCSEPTAMPEYASLMGLEDVADILTYLLEQKGPAEAAGPASVPEDG